MSKADIGRGTAPRHDEMFGNRDLDFGGRVRTRRLHSGGGTWSERGREEKQYPWYCSESEESGGGGNLGLFFSHGHGFS